MRFEDLNSDQYDELRVYDMDQLAQVYLGDGAACAEDLILRLKEHIDHCGVIDPRKIANEARQEDHRWLDAKRRESEGGKYLSIYDAPNYSHVCWLNEEIAKRIGRQEMAVAEPEPDGFRPVDANLPAVLPEDAGKGCGTTVLIFIMLGALIWWMVG